MRVLVAMDGTPNGEEALAAVANWARESGTELVLLTVLDPDKLHETVQVEQGYASTPLGAPSGQPLPAVLPASQMRVTEDRTQALERVRMATEANLAASAAHLAPGVAAAVRVEWDGHVPQAIISAAKEAGVDFIAMGTHSRKGVERLLLGSTAQEVIRHSPVPVLVVREGMVTR